MPAQKAEAANETELTFEYDGAEYTAPREPDLDILEALEDEKPVTAVRALLGRNQYAEFRKNHSSVEDLGKLFEAYGEAAGLGK